MKMMISKQHLKFLNIRILIFLIIIRGIHTLDIPSCDFHDTVDLADSIKLKDGSYIYDGIKIPPNLIGEYDYTVLFGGEKIGVLPHMRACLCQLKTCVRFCCHPQVLLDSQSGECSTEFPENLNINPTIKITYQNGSALETAVLKHFVVQQSKPCWGLYPLHVENGDQWELFENGTLLRRFDNVYLTKRDYCLQTVYDFESHTFVVKPHNCPTANAPDILYTINMCLMTISILFMLLTIIAYILIRNFYNIYEKCFICYLIALTIGYTTLVIVFQSELSAVSCLSVGYTGYFAFMSAFLWLTVLSYDLWSTVCGRRSNISKESNLFIYYNLYAWTAAIILTLAIYVIDQSNMNEEWKPNVGYYTCWIDTSNWTAMVYFFGPMLLLILFNSVMYTLSIRRIAKIMKSLRDHQLRAEHAHRVRSYKQNCSLYLRLFLIMGLTWIFEIISFLYSGSETLAKFLVFADLLNASQGIIIFLVFILLRAKIRKLVINRIQCRSLNNIATDNKAEGISLQDRIEEISILN